MGLRGCHFARAEVLEDGLIGLGQFVAQLHMRVARSGECDVQAPRAEDHVQDRFAAGAGEKTQPSHCHTRDVTGCDRCLT